MQEEPGETLIGDGDGTAMWTCPLCQVGQPDRRALASHLTDRHSVLPACLEKLLDIAVPVQCTSGKAGESDSQNNTDAMSEHQEPLENTTSPHEASRQEGELADGDHTLNNTGGKHSSSLEREEGEEQDGLGSQETTGSEQDVASQSGKNMEASARDEKFAGKNGIGGEGEGARPYKCNACQEFFATKTALSVHYNSTSHVQRMRTGSSKQQSGETSPSTTPYLARPYISNKPYQCAVCRVSYNHAITLESHLKSVLHQTRSRSAGNTSGSASAAGGSQGGGAALSGCSVGSGAAQASPAASPVATKEGEQIQPALAPSLLSCPMASAQAVSAFLTLLTSNPSALPHPMLPSLFATGAGPAATPQLVPQPHMLMPLILNGLQNQSPNPESPSQLLPQSVPILGLSAAQQALLVQRLQSQWAAMGLSPAPANLSDTMVGGEGGTHLKEETQAESIAEQMPLKLEMKAEEDESLCVKKELLRPAAPGRWFGKDSDGQEVGSDGTPCKDEDEVESTSDKGSAKKASVKIGQCDSPSSCVSETTRSLSLNKNSVNSLALKPSPTKSNPLKYTRALSSLGHTHTKAHIASPVLSEFQSQLLWAFLESRSEADAASPPQEDCEALSREVGLTEGEVRRWLEDHAKDRQDHAKDRQRSGGPDHMSQHRDNSMEEEDEEGPLMIDEAGLTHSPTTRGTHSAMDLSSCTDRRKEKGTDSCLTSDSENEEFYTSVIVTDEESQSSSMREETDFPMKETTTVDTTGEKSSGGGKVLRSTTVFLSDAEDEDDDEEGVVKREKRKMRKRELDREEVDAKRERRDPDVDLELEAQADPPAPLQVSVDQRGLPSGLLQSLPLSLSLAPFSTQFISPYVLSIPSSVVGVGVAEGDGAKLPGFPAPPAMPRGQAPTGVSLSQSSQFLSNGGECESALDLSIGKNHSSTSTSSSASAGDKSSVQKGNLLDGLGLRPAAVGGPGEAGGLIVVQVKPDPSIAIPTFNSSTLVNRNNLYKPEAHNTREKEKEREKEREQKRPKARRFRDMRRSRTIIQADQLDVLYGCYFKDPNPGKYEFEQISEWVNLPKKVVQIWFQNMRARERKGEVRFISDGTLAAVGKPLIKFTWPLTQPIFSSVPKSNTNSSTGVTSKPNPIPAHIPPKTEQLKDRGTVKSPPQAPNKPNLGAAPILATNTSVTVGQKVKAEPLNSISMVKIAPKGFPPVAPKLCGSSPSPLPSQKPKPEQEAAEEEHTDEEDDLGPETFKPGLGNRTVPKLPNTPISKSSAVTTQKHNGQSYWPQKGPFKINTLSREQLGLGAPRSPSTNTPVISPPAAATPSQGHKDGAGAQHATPRRPRTHLTCLQLSILQSCYETCAHPNALECEAVGVELGLPLKVVQIWFQNTRAKEKRWRLQQEKQSPNSGDPSKKVDVSSGSYLQYNALRANRPILPKPVQLTVVEPSPPTTVGQPAGRETLRGRCEACDVVFESRAMARAHVFSPRHLATLRTTNFGQPAVLPNSGSGPSPGAGSAGAGPAALSPASSTSP